MRITRRFVPIWHRAVFAGPRRPHTLWAAQAPSAMVSARQRASASSLPVAPSACTGGNTSAEPKCRRVGCVRGARSARCGFAVLRSGCTRARERKQVRATHAGARATSRALRRRERLLLRLASGARVITARHNKAIDTDAQVVRARCALLILGAGHFYVRPHMKISDDQRPLWVAFPDIPWGSLGWRMGFGEAYANAWVPWFKALSDDERRKYIAQWPEPEPWKGFYQFHMTGAVPPHIIEKNRRIEAAAGEPAPDEVKVTDYHRILWLLRYHLKRVKVLNVRPGEVFAELWEAPQGEKWRMSALEPQGMQLTRELGDEV